MNSTPAKNMYEVALQDRQENVDAIVRARAARKLVVGGPGTGKTFLFKTVLGGKSDTLTLTFVNALVRDLARELFGVSEVKTLHAFARGQLARATGKKVRVFPKLSKVIQQDGEILLGTRIEFEELFHNRRDDPAALGFYKSRRRYYGLYGFTDVVFAAVLYFEQHPEKIPCYSQVVVDEFQDFNTLEVSLIELLATKSPVLLAGDDDQALYESLKSASPRHIRARHAREIGDYSCFCLPYCSRNARVIVDAANDIVASAKANGLLVGRIEKRFEYFPDAQKDAVSEANPRIFHARVFARQVPWFIGKEIENIARGLTEEFSVLVLSPTRMQCENIHSALKAKGFENVHFGERRHDDVPSFLDGLKLLLADSACNLGWRLVSRELLAPTEFEALLRQSYSESEGGMLVQHIKPCTKKLVRRLLGALRLIRNGKPCPRDGVSELLDAIGIDPYNLAAASLRGEISAVRGRLSEPGIRGTPIVTTTIQSSKGRDADYVFITHVDDRYLMREWEVGISDQDVCGFLVALTRAKRRAYLLSTDRSRSPTFLSWIAGSRICSASNC